MSASGCWAAVINVALITLLFHCLQDWNCFWSWIFFSFIAEIRFILDEAWSKWTLSFPIPHPSRKTRNPVLISTSKMTTMTDKAEKKNVERRVVLIFRSTVFVKYWSNSYIYIFCTIYYAVNKLIWKYPYQISNSVTKKRTFSSVSGRICNSFISCNLLNDENLFQYICQVLL